MDEEIKIPPEDIEKELIEEKKEYTADEKKTILQKIQGMSVPERVRLALWGNREVRGILIRDPNKAVRNAVLSSPRITDSEIIQIANSRNTDEDVLRQIPKNRNWMRNYGVIMALVTNPKTPLSISTGLLSKLREKDLAFISKSKNVPTALQREARRLYLIKLERH